MVSEVVSTPHFDKLHTENYLQWHGNIFAVLMMKEWLHLVPGNKLRPVSVVSQAPTKMKHQAFEKWDDKALRAAGELYLSLSDDQKTLSCAITISIGKLKK
ncbi:uncharacterized protein PHACADRAFT_200348 [Phanerochaete carnosa HHB-10118-sp]|uniref:Retrotransposon Copia-like N-terminal domain-containing protein n=1 Tax=Phanerochaete carnosa (strain HHB-10118-sp) TaxID=650164 RepID=K5VV10_PHACS|nr:uncharacterized protein PHACADRAFT_200348 [Phanerochaete carnosa HHB-10118-sp]EKM50404.1 hypothetical protein PHACADRAFT_200348 [Phanerochaete carnosa HHB-10118-sp]